MKEFETHPDDRKKAVRTSMAVYILFLFFLLFPFMSFQIPAPGEEGILVSFGMPDMGRGDGRPDTQQKEDVPPKPEETPPPPQESKAEPVKAPEKEIVTQEDPNAVALRKQKEEEVRKKAEADRQKQLEEQRKREEEARKQAEYDAAKKQFGDLLGSGKGKTNTPGNQGDPLGDPNADNLEGLSTGMGSVGGGLGGRQVRYKPQVVESSQKTGKVVISVCVNDKGSVISADYTQRGSTTGEAELINTAIKFAKQYRFSESTASRQCGTITFDFKVK